MKDFSEYKNVWVFAEQRQGKLMNVALELIGEGYKLSREISKDTKLAPYLQDMTWIIWSRSCMLMGQTVYMFCRTNSLHSIRPMHTQR